MPQNPSWSRSYPIAEIVELSGVTGALKDFAINHLIYVDELLSVEEKLFLVTLQESQSKPTLTDQIFYIFEKSGIDVISNGHLQQCIKTLAQDEWPDQALEFFDYLVTHASFPLEKWPLCFVDYGVWHSLQDIKKWIAGHPLPARGSSKTSEQHILEGVFRHFQENPLSTSPFSIKFWFHDDICNQLTSDDKAKDDTAKIKTFLSNLAEGFCKEMLDRELLDQAKEFLIWLKRNKKANVFDTECWRDMLDSIANVPVPAPLTAFSLNDPEAIPIYINALTHSSWQNNGGPIEYPTLDEKEIIINKLEDIATKCAQDKIRLPHKQMTALLHMPYWEAEQDIYYKPNSHQVPLALKLFSLMRSRLQNEPTMFEINDYRQALNILITAKEHNKLLKQLLITLRQSPEPCSDDSLEFKPKEKMLVQPFDGMSPYLCVSCLIHLLLTIYDQKRSLCLELSQYCLSRIKFKKGMHQQFDKTEGFYDEQLCVEPNPIWRSAYVKALGEVGYDLNGKVNSTLDFIKKHDPSEMVRADAKSSYKVIHRETNKKLDDHKGFMAAFFWLRWAQRAALSAIVNPGSAMLTRRGELRRDQQHSADLLYWHFCWHI